MLENSMKLNKIVAAATFAVSSAVASFGFAAGVKVDPALPEYTPATGVSGNFYDQLVEKLGERRACVEFGGMLASWRNKKFAGKL